MSSLTRFEFYNNFDIWCDLYQENGGDPNYVINIIMYNDRIRCENVFVKENTDAHGNGMVDWYKYGFGEGHTTGFGEGYGDGDRHLTGYLFKCGNGTF